MISSLQKWIQKSFYQLAIGFNNPESFTVYPVLRGKNRKTLTKSKHLEMRHQPHIVRFLAQGFYYLR
jgi:hypothetical protein